MNFLEILCSNFIQIDILLADNNIHAYANFQDDPTMYADPAEGDGLLGRGAPLPVGGGATDEQFASERS